MRFTIKREELLKGLNTASRAVASKNVKSVLENFKLNLDERGLFITGTDENISIKTQVPYRLGDELIIRNYKEGSILIKAKLLVEIVRKMDSEEITLDVVDSTIATISNNRSEYRLNCVNTDEYPELDLEATGTQLSLSRADFDVLVSQTTFAASFKEQRPILTALNLEARGGILTATATDSARMARKTLNIPLGIEFVANIPAKMMDEINHLLEGKDSVDIAVSDKKALFTMGTTIVSTRLIAGDYPNTKNIVPKITNYSLEVNANDLMKAIDRANILSIDRENIVDLSMSEEGIEISAKSSQVGSAVEKIDVFKYVGQDLHVSFNSGFVIEAVKALGSTDVVFAFVGEMKPFVIENASDDSVVQVVTPVRTY
ncbi:MAG TPA: DNA polymerase III subunit beta [Erysipelotrichaceae bacterium]|nr:DNA polymerase III subunit beta [Erysipelotrichaceae bacterium]